ncbi:MAG: hypothetical protein ACT4OM_01465 [Actinomycetota bacterium]
MTNRTSSSLILSGRDLLLVAGGGVMGKSGPGCEWRRPQRDPAASWQRFGPATNLNIRGPVVIEDAYATPGMRQIVALVDDPGGAYLGRFVVEGKGPWGAPIPITGSKNLLYSGTPAFLQSDRLPGGAYDVFAPLEEGVAHFMCNSPEPVAPWLLFRFAEGAGRIDALAVVESRLGTGRFELLVRQGPVLAALWCDKNGSPGRWSRRETLFDNAAGRPAIIQGRFGVNGHLEVLTLDKGGNLWHAWRNNDDSARPVWNGPAMVCPAPAGTSSVGRDDFVGLLQHAPGPADPGTLEASCSIFGRHHHFRRDQAPPWKWHGPLRVGTDR